MVFDALTVSAVAAELRTTILGGRVQDVVQTDDLSLAFELYANRQRHYLVASIHPQLSRVHVTQRRARRGIETPTPLWLLLHKFVERGHLVAIEQPAWERILRLSFDGDEGPTTLVCEVMGRLSNAILLDAGGIILDSLKHVTRDMTRARLVLPRRPYVPPPPLDRPSPVELTADRLRGLIAAAAPGTRLWRVLLNGQRGLSPLAAREVAFRATGNAEVEAAAAPVDAVVAAQTALAAPVTTGDWQPSLARQQNAVVAYAPYLLTQYDDAESAAGISAAVEAYVDSSAGADTYAGARKAVQAQIDEARDRLARRRDALARAAVGEAEVEQLRLKGELVLAYASSLSPGQAMLEAEYDPEQPPLRIALDPALSPLENAQRYFRDYDKAKGARAEVPGRLAETDLTLTYLDQLETDLVLASNRPEIAAVRAELAEAGLTVEGKPPRAAGRAHQDSLGRPMRVQSPDGFVVWVGRNAHQNEEVTFTRAAGHDLWLHARGVPGAHVVVKTEGRPVPESTVDFAARLAATYSRARGSTHVAVDVTEQRNVRHIKGAALGMVTYRNERTVLARPDTK